MYKTPVRFLILLISLAFFSNAFAINIYSSEDSSVDAYGSLRMQAETIDADTAQAGESSSYNGIRDAYTRFGIKASTAFSDDLTLSAKIEIPFNLADLRQEDPTFFEGFYKENYSPRIYKVTASSKKFGTINFGKQWLAYYNNIAYPVDYFSSFYAGYSTYAYFRREALTYTTPTFSGFSATISGVDLFDGIDSSTGESTKYLDTMQYIASYAQGPFNVAVAYQDTVNDRANLIAASASYTVGPWRFAGKIEQQLTDSSVVSSATTNIDPILYNIYGSYTVDQWTMKATYANGDGEEGAGGEAFFIGDTYQLGVDYQYNPKMKFFAEYFFEQNSYAIYTPNSDAFDPLAGFQVESDSHAFLVGGRFDF